MSEAFREEDVRICIQHIAQGRFTEAAPLARQLLAQAPNFSFFLYLHGLICTRLGLKEEALAALERAITITNQGGDKAWTDDMRGVLTRPEMWFELGNLHASEERWDEAIRSYRMATALRPNFADAHQRIQGVLQRGVGPAPLLVTVVTATTGQPELERAVQSVQSQTYANIEHLLVVDNPQAAAQVHEICRRNQGSVPCHCMELPYKTGEFGFNGHRIYAASAFLARGDYVSFLDEDNWFDADHIASLVERIAADGLEWAYSLRKICNADGSVLAVDNGNSLGQWPTAESDATHLVDANCYMIRRDLAVRTSAIWNSRYPDIIRFLDKRPIVSPDYSLCMKLLAEHPRCGTNGQYSLNYRVGNAAYSADASFFHRQNAKKLALYPGKLPWVRSDAVFLQVGAGDALSESQENREAEGDWIYRHVVKYGWRGILVEPHPELRRKLIDNYTGKGHGLFFEEVAIDACDGRRDFSLCHARPQLSAFLPTMIERCDPDGALGLLQGIESISVPCMTVTTLLKKYGLSQIDVLHIDTGGHEAVILEGIDWQAVRVGMIRFGHWNLTTNERARICDTLLACGYALVEGMRFTTATQEKSGVAGYVTLGP